MDAGGPRGVSVGVAVGRVLHHWHLLGGIYLPPWAGAFVSCFLLYDFLCVCVFCFLCHFFRA